jgi:Ca2+-binding EF-hand superfamily protein
MRSAVQGYIKTLLAVVALLAVGVGGVQAQDAPSTRVKQEKKDRNVKAGEKEAKKLILLMDKDQNGKVSKEEFMAFMEAEFERLDVDKNGSLDVAELTQSRVQTSSGHSR